MAVETDYAARHVDSRVPTIFDKIDFMFCIIFTIELIQRIFVFQHEFFHGIEGAWNVFDSILVIYQITDISTDCYMDSSSFLNSAAFDHFRLLRLVRILRVLKLFGSASVELNLILESLTGSMSPFFWTMVLLMSLLFCFSIIFTEISTAARKDSQKDTPELDTYFGSFCWTLLSLFESVAGGQSWDLYVRPLAAISPWAGAAFCLFESFALFAVMNIITAIFVSSSSDRCQKDRIVASTYTAFDPEQVEHIERCEFRDCLEVETNAMVGYFRNMSLDTQYAAELFDVIDVHADGKVEIHEFVDAMGRLTRPAMALDTVLILQQVYLLGDLLNKALPASAN